MAHVIRSDLSAFDDYTRSIQQQTPDRRGSGQLREAFGKLLETTAHMVNRSLVSEDRITFGNRTIRFDGTLRDQWRLPYGYWEARQPGDPLDTELHAGLVKHYPVKNVIFQGTRHAVLYQNGSEAMRADLFDREQVAAMLTSFYTYDMPPFQHFSETVAHFQGDIVTVANSLMEKIKAAHLGNPRFKGAHAVFTEMCRTALNPGMRREAVDEMLVQHMLAERLIRTALGVDGFARYNIIAAEIERVIGALTSPYFNRAEIISPLNPFYEAVERAAEELVAFDDRRAFISAIFERFFQGLGTRAADHTGFAQTPQEIVNFMCAAVAEILQHEFGQHLGADGVTALDPCAGTGTFAAGLLRRITPHRLDRFYRTMLFANEVSLLPYYLAAINIEYEYYRLTDRYQPFTGLCLVDTLDLKQAASIPVAEENAERIARQQDTPIAIIIGSPPASIAPTADKRRYEAVDGRLQTTYASTPASSPVLQDAAAHFFRWAVDRLNGQDGVVCFVTPNVFMQGETFAAMRKHLAQEFTTIYHLDLGSLSGQAGRAGLGITIAVRASQHKEFILLHHRLPVNWQREKKLAWLEHITEDSAATATLQQIPWQAIQPDVRQSWIKQGPERAATATTQQLAGEVALELDAIFQLTSPGIHTGADPYLYDYDRHYLTERADRIINDYQAQLGRWVFEPEPKDLDRFLVINEKVHKWVRTTRQALLRGDYAEFNPDNVRTTVYRPFTKKYYYFDPIFSDNVGEMPRLFPVSEAEDQNRIICIPAAGSGEAFFCLMTNMITDGNLAGETQCLPFYIFNADGSNPRENISGAALARFQDHYSDTRLNRWDIFYYIYGLLHLPAYQERLTEDLLYQAPRIPLVGSSGDFWTISEAGSRLAALHLNFDAGKRYSLKLKQDGISTFTFRVEKMALDKDRATLRFNDSITLGDVPSEAFAYRLGKWSALEWLIDQYQTKTDARSGITADPNAFKHERYIIGLVERVVHLSVETVRIVQDLQQHLTAGPR